ncbi:MAG: AEC family transporter [Eubacteriales bacterium]|nr:AEC family transporter [Eubacteriales bacterium]
MQNLVFSLNATIPVFLMMILGYFFHKIGWIDDAFASKMNKFVFVVPLPALLFHDLAEVDFYEVWDTKFVLFCFGTTVISIMFAAALSCVWKDKSIRGEFVQASYRSSAAILGIAFIQNIYGTSGMAPLMIIGSVPLYNVMAVFVLSLLKPGQKRIDHAVMRKTLIGIAKNPIILGIAAGLLWSALRIPLPAILSKTASSVGSMTTPMGLMAMGASFDFGKALEKKWPTVTAAFIKLIGFCAVFLPIAVHMGFQNEKLVAILVMLGSATTVTSYVMAKNMGHEGVLSSGTVMLTTLCSAFTLTFWLWLLRSLGLV